MAERVVEISYDSMRTRYPHLLVVQSDAQSIQREVCNAIDRYGEDFWKFVKCGGSATMFIATLPYQMCSSIVAQIYIVSDDADRKAAARGTKIATEFSNRGLKLIPKYYGGLTYALDCAEKTSAYISLFDLWDNTVEHLIEKFFVSTLRTDPKDALPIYLDIVRYVLYLLMQSSDMGYSFRKFTFRNVVFRENKPSGAFEFALFGFESVYKETDVAFTREYNVTQLQYAAREVMHRAGRKGDEVMLMREDAYRSMLALFKQYGECLSFTDPDFFSSQTGL